MTTTATATRLPTYFISHGGGPWPWMKAETGGAYDKLAASLAAMLSELPQQPRAILMVSAHWEADAFTAQANPAPGMIYDYGGFPAHTYQVRYGSPGDPALAARVQQQLVQAGIPAATDPTRGYDHGMFSPMAVIRPDASVPVVQLSLRRGLDPAEHLAVGRALAPLRDEGVLIVGSGLSYHNLRAFNSRGQAASHAFDGWLQQAVVGQAGAPRTRALLAWEAAPAARLAHPREEHLLPLMVAVGAAENEAGKCIYHEEDFMGALAVSSFRFGGTGRS